MTFFFWHLIFVFSYGLVLKQKCLGKSISNLWSVKEILFKFVFPLSLLKQIPGKYQQNCKRLLHCRMWDQVCALWPHPIIIITKRLSLALLFVSEIPGISSCKLNERRCMFMWHWREAGTRFYSITTRSVRVNKCSRHAGVTSISNLLRVRMNN